MASRRSRAIKLPPVPRATVNLHGLLFSAEDVQQIAERAHVEDSKLTLKDDMAPETFARALDNAFRDAIVSAIMEDRLLLQDPAWFRRLGRDARRFLITLGLTPERCTAMAVPLTIGPETPGIYHLQEAAGVMRPVFWPPVELSDVLSDDPPVQQKTTDTERACAPSPSDDKQLAKVLLQLLPRTLGLVLLLADECASTTPKRPPGAGGDILRRALFGQLVHIHLRMFGRGPRTRDKINKRRGASIPWARSILEIARDRMPAVCNGEARWYVRRVADLADKSDDTLGVWLEEAWSSTQA